MVPSQAEHTGSAYSLLPPAFGDGVIAHLNRQPPSDHHITQLRTDGVHRRESAGTGPVVVIVARVAGDAYSDGPFD